jgi:hypothetical protein
MGVGVACLRGVKKKKKRETTFNRARDRFRTFRGIVLMRCRIRVHCVDVENGTACAQMVFEFSSQRAQGMVHERVVFAWHDS